MDKQLMKCQIGITSLVQEAQINAAFLPKNAKGRVKFEFHKLLDNLNAVLLSQYLQKSDNCLSKDDIVTLQDSDPVLRGIIEKLSKSSQIDDNFVIKNFVEYMYVRKPTLMCKLYKQSLKC